MLKDYLTEMAEEGIVDYASTLSREFINDLLEKLVEDMLGDSVSRWLNGVELVLKLNSCAFLYNMNVVVIYRLVHNNKPGPWLVSVKMVDDIYGGPEDWNKANAGASSEIGHPKGERRRIIQGV